MAVPGLRSGQMAAGCITKGWAQELCWRPSVTTACRSVTWPCSCYTSSMQVGGVLAVAGLLCIADAPAADLSV
jgi:hypothetical protein